MGENEGHRIANLKRLTAKVIRAINPERVIALTQEFVRIPSVSGQEGKLGQFMAEKLKALGFDDVELQEADEDRFNVLCTLRGKHPGPTFLFEGHLDTVQTEGMAINPYSGDFSDGRIYGRGASDMKGGLAAMVEALKAIKDSGVTFDGTIIYAAVVGEEGAGKGLDKLIASGLKADIGLVGEATELIGHRQQRRRCGGYNNQGTGDPQQCTTLWCQRHLQDVQGSGGHPEAAAPPRGKPYLGEEYRQCEHDRGGTVAHLRSRPLQDNLRLPSQP